MNSFKFSLSNRGKKVFSKGQFISKAEWHAIDSPKKQTDEFVLFAFLLFTANKSNSSVRFLGESMARQSAFRNYLTFILYTLYIIQLHTFLWVINVFTVDTEYKKWKHKKCQHFWISFPNYKTETGLQVWFASPLSYISALQKVSDWLEVRARHIPIPN